MGDLRPGPDDDYNRFNRVYKPGAVFKHTGRLLQIHTDQGISGEFLGVAYDWDFILAHRTGPHNCPG
jgi:hypothetical protein